MERTNADYSVVSLCTLLYEDVHFQKHPFKIALVHPPERMLSNQISA